MEEHRPRMAELLSGPLDQNTRRGWIETTNQERLACLVLASWNLWFLNCYWSSSVIPSLKKIRSCLNFEMNSPNFGAETKHTLQLSNHFWLKVNVSKKGSSLLMTSHDLTCSLHSVFTTIRFFIVMKGATFHWNTWHFFCWNAGISRLSLMLAIAKTDNQKYSRTSRFESVLASKSPHWQTTPDTKADSVVQFRHIPYIYIYIKHIHV